MGEAPLRSSPVRVYVAHERELVAARGHGWGKGGTVMLVHRLLSGRGVAAVVTLTAAMLGTLPGTALGAVPPQQVRGVVGRFNVHDSSALAAPYCIYPFGDPGVRSPLSYFHVRPPRVLAHDDGDANHHESQTVGYRLIIQRATHPKTGPWTTVKVGSVFKKTAFEDMPARYFPRDIIYPGGGVHTFARLIVRLTWYNGHGRVVGSVKHWYHAYARIVSSGINPDWSSEQGQVVFNKCPSSMVL
jgi:hypothetical protein